jgi:hypothetical protein
MVECYEDVTAQSKQGIIPNYVWRDSSLALSFENTNASNDFRKRRDLSERAAASSLEFLNAEIHCPAAFARSPGTRQGAWPVVARPTQNGLTKTPTGERDGGAASATYDDGILRAGQTTRHFRHTF